MDTRTKQCNTASLFRWVNWLKKNSFSSAEMLNYLRSWGRSICHLTSGRCCPSIKLIILEELFDHFGLIYTYGGLLLSGQYEDMLRMYLHCFERISFFQFFPLLFHLQQQHHMGAINVKTLLLLVINFFGQPYITGSYTDGPT